MPTRQITRLALMVCFVGYHFLRALVAPAAAHDFWINHGQYKSPAGVHCCGPSDCEQLSDSQVSIGPAGYSLILEGRDGKPMTEIVPFPEAQPSEDSKYWRCHKYDGSRRCFFAPQPGS